MNAHELEKLRKKALKVIVLQIVLFIILSVLIYFLTKNIFYSFITILIGVFDALLSKYKSRKKFISAVYDKYVLSALESVFTDVKIEPCNGIDYSTFSNMRLIKNNDTYSSSNYIYGKYKNVEFIQSDICVERRLAGVEASTENIINGRWITILFEKSFNTNIQICQKGYGNNLRLWNEIYNYEKIKTGNEKFDKKFNVYAKNPEEAHRFLTTSLKEKILKISNLLGKKIFLCFINNELNIGIQNSKFAIKISVFRKVDEEKITEQVLKNIKPIITIIDEALLH